jgi:transcriptional regulator of acetoin/glycerol metabolism
MNVRELEQCLRASAVLAESGLVTVRELPPSILDAPGEQAEVVALDAEDEALLKELTQKLKETRGNVSEVARLMGKARQQVQRWLRRFNLDPTTFR